jgi:CPA2 family monovalent cation:H+ antiporter-2
MASPVAPSDYKDLVLFLATAGVVVPLFKRLKVSPILGFLGAGVALGPSGLGRLASQLPWLEPFTVANPEEIAQLAEFGVVFLLFSIGLELSWDRLRLMRRAVFGLGALQMLTCTLVLTLAGKAVGLSWTEGLLIGAALALSSTAVVMPSMAEHGRLHSPAGRAVFAVLLFQDLAVAPILVTVGALGRGGTLSLSSLLAFLPAIAGLALLVGVGRLVLRPMMKSVARAKSEELFMAATLLVVIGAGLAAAFGGLSMALGAFVAGLLLAETEYRHEVEVTVEPFKGLLLGLFFVSVGISLDLSLVFRDPLLVLGIALGLLLIKAVIVLGLGRLLGATASGSTETALSLAAAGEFAFVVVGAGSSAHFLSAEVAQPALAAATLSMFCIPALIGLGAKLGLRVAEARPEVAAPPAEPEPESEARVLVVGFGRVGRLVADMLSRHKVAWVGLERDPRLVERGRREGGEVYVGDASRAELLRRCGLDKAPALVVTMDSPETVEAVVAEARRMRPDLVIVARARDARQAGKLYALGVTDAVPETIEASLQLSEAVLVDVGVPMGLVIASIHEKRDEYRKLLNRPEALGGRRRARRS